MGNSSGSFRRCPFLRPRKRRRPDRAIEYESVRLFDERARAALPSFVLSAGNRQAVTDICRRLDGLPLAIELAAARVRALSAEQIAARLDDCFRVLGGGHRTELPRHQTLRAAIDWSYDLLTDPERELLRRLSVFVDSFTLEAAEDVASDSAWTAPTSSTFSAT